VPRASSPLPLPVDAEVYPHVSLLRWREAQFNLLFCLLAVYFCFALCAALTCHFIPSEKPQVFTENGCFIFDVFILLKQIGEMGWKLISKIKTHMYDIKLRSWSQKCYIYRIWTYFFLKKLTIWTLNSFSANWPWSYVTLYIAIKMDGRCLRMEFSGEFYDLERGINTKSGDKCVKNFVICTIQNYQYLTFKH